MTNHPTQLLTPLIILTLTAAVSELQGSSAANCPREFFNVRALVGAIDVSHIQNRELISARTKLI